MVVPSSDARGAGVACLVFALLLHPHGVEGRGVQLMAIGALSTCEKKSTSVSSYSEQFQTVVCVFVNSQNVMLRLFDVNHGKQIVPFMLD